MATNPTDGEREDTTNWSYVIRTNAQFEGLEQMDVGALADAVTDPWFNQTLCRVNDCVVRLGVFQGEFHWHAHEREDEYFFVVSGRLLVDLEGRTIELEAGQGVLVPRTVVHRTRAPGRTVVLMIEGASVTPTGDA